jgi:hypothetical protein
VNIDAQLADLKLDEDEDEDAAAKLLLVKKVEYDVTQGAVRDPLGVNTEIDLSESDLYSIKA